MNAGGLEIALEEALSSVKADLEIKQNAALQELQICFDRKCVEMQSQHACELQSLKAQLTAQFSRSQTHPAVCDPLTSLGQTLSRAEVEVMQREPDTVQTGEAQRGVPVAGTEQLDRTQFERLAVRHARQSLLATDSQDTVVPVIKNLHTSSSLIQTRRRSAQGESLFDGDAAAGIRVPYAAAPFPDVPEASNGPVEQVVRRQAIEFFREQKRMLRRRQLAMHKARQEWHQNAEMLARVEPSSARDEMIVMLKQVHHTLETQARRLNDDALQLALARKCCERPNWDGKSDGSTIARTVADMSNPVNSRQRTLDPAWCAVLTTRGPQPEKAQHGRSLSLRDLSTHMEAEYTLHRHAKWLRSLREQIVKVSQIPRSTRANSNATDGGTLDTAAQVTGK
eukprot:jgi/Ulvmu1/3369/UM156_0026.1